MKKTIKILVSLFVLVLFCGYTLVSGKWIIGNDIESSSLLSKNIFLNSGNFNWTILKLQTTIDLEDTNTVSMCNISSTLLGAKDGYSYLKIAFNDDKCSNSYISIKDKKGKVLISNIKMKLFSDGNIFNIFSDLSNDHLNKSLTKIEINILKYSEYKEYSSSSDENYFDFMKKNRFYKELLYKKSILVNILVSRGDKYIIPVPGYNISEKLSKIPNAKRGYREEYTDGIHHGWDVDSPIGSSIVSMDDGVIIRIVKGFLFEDLLNINKSTFLTYDDNLKNLDILRGNQVWLKTSKGDIVFYSHLTDISNNIYEGKVLSAGDYIGTVGVTGIPDKNYTDYHLHFAIHKNPYNIKKAGKYSNDDYMKWDWYFKGKSSSYILENQKNIFSL